MDNQQLRSFDKDGQSSTTIPVMGSKDILKNIPETEQFLISDFRSIPKISGIYCIYNILNSKVYIGISKNIRKRIKEHCYTFKADVLHSGEKFKKALKKYTLVNFKVYILEKTEESLKEKEALYIERFNSVKNGYNIQYFDSNYKLTWKLSEEMKEKQLKNRYDKQISIKSTLVYNLKGEFLQKFPSRVMAADHYNITRRLLNECVNKNSLNIKNNKYFSSCNNLIFIDDTDYDGRPVIWVNHKERCKNLKIKQEVMDSFKKECFLLNIETLEILKFPMIKDLCKFLNIKERYYQHHKNKEDFIFNDKYKLIKNKI